MTNPEQEVALLKATFKGQESLLKAMRGLLLGFEITKTEQKTIAGVFSDSAVLTAVRNKIYPVFSNETPLESISDFWMGMESQIQGKSKAEIQQVVKSKGKVLDMLEQAIGLLKNPSAKQVDISYSPKSVEKDPLQIGLLARILYIKTILNGIAFVHRIAEMKDETPEETAKRLALDSNK